MVDQDQFDRMSMQDKESQKFVLDSNGNVAIRVKDVTNVLDLGYYVDPTALNTAHPTADVGSFAIVGSTDTVWIRDDLTASWVDSGSQSTPNYINAGVNNIAVGGIGAHEGPFNTTLQDMFDRLLYPATNQTSVLTISGPSVFEKGVEQAPRTLTATTTRTTNPTYAITSTVFKRAGTVISTQAGDTTPRTFAVVPTIVDTTTFSCEVTNANAVTTTSSKTLTAVYPYFRGVVADTSPTIDQALIDSGTKVVASSSGDITIDFNSLSNEFCWFAIPETSSAYDTWYVNALNNGTIGQPGDWFPTATIISVDSPDGYWTGVNYRVYVASYVSAVTDPVTFSN